MRISELYSSIAFLESPTAGTYLMMICRTERVSRRSDARGGRGKGGSESKMKTHNVIGMLGSVNRRVGSDLTLLLHLSGSEGLVKQVIGLQKVQIRLMIRGAKRERTDIDHVVDDRGLGDLLGSELSRSVQVSSVVVSQMVVSCRVVASVYVLCEESGRRTSDRERLDTGGNEVIGENGFDLRRGGQDWNEEGGCGGLTLV